MVHLRSTAGYGWVRLARLGATSLFSERKRERERENVCVCERERERGCVCNGFGCCLLALESLSMKEIANL